MKMMSSELAGRVTKYGRNTINMAEIIENRMYAAHTFYIHFHICAISEANTIAIYKELEKLGFKCTLHREHIKFKNLDYEVKPLLHPDYTPPKEGKDGFVEEEMYAEEEVQVGTIFISWASQCWKNGPPKAFVENSMFSRIASFLTGHGFGPKVTWLINSDLFNRRYNAEYMYNHTIEYATIAGICEAHIMKKIEDATKEGKYEVEVRFDQYQSAVLDKNYVIKYFEGFGYKIDIQVAWFEYGYIEYKCFISWK